MSIKAFFKSNTDYGADELNRIVKYLRTDGVYGEITDCLKVSKGSGTVVNIADGIGWVSGCGIEVSGGYSITLPTTAATYYIYMSVTTQSDHTTAADITYTTEEPENENCILASVVVASGAISTVTDTRVNSQFKGSYQFAPTYHSGTVTLTGTISAANATTVKSFTVPVGVKKARLYMANSNSSGLLFEIGEGLGIMSGKNHDGSFHRSTELKTSFYFISGSPRGIGAYAASADGSVLIDNVVLQSLSNEVQITFKARVASAQIDCKIDWEAW